LINLELGAADRSFLRLALTELEGEAALGILFSASLALEAVISCFAEPVLKGASAADLVITDFFFGLI